jgi:hypothetical protein
MICWNASDSEIIGAAIRYQIVRRERGEAALPSVMVPLHWRVSQQQPDTAEVDFAGREPRVVRRFNQPSGDKCE